MALDFKRLMRTVKYTKEFLEPIVKNSHSISEVIKKLRMKMTGGTHAHIKKRIKELNIDFSHFNGHYHRLNVSPTNKRFWSEILVNNSYVRTSLLRRALIESGREYKCEWCKLLPIWNSKKLCIQIDHIDGNKSNNFPSNLRFLCPNCHSQTDTFGFKNATVAKPVYA